MKVGGGGPQATSTLRFFGADILHYSYVYYNAAKCFTHRNSSMQTQTLLFCWKSLPLLPLA